MLQSVLPRYPKRRRASAIPPLRARGFRLPGSCRGAWRAPCAVTLRPEEELLGESSRSCSTCRYEGTPIGSAQISETPQGERHSPLQARGFRLARRVGAHGVRPARSRKPRLPEFTQPKTKKPQGVALGLFLFNPGDDLLSHTVTDAVPSALEGLTTVFGMGTGVTPPLQSPESQNFRQGKFYGQASRPISTGKLHALPHFHIQPITWWSSRSL